MPTIATLITRTRAYLYPRFKTGAKPTQADFADVFNSFVHKTEDTFPADRITGLDLIAGGNLLKSNNTWAGANDFNQLVKAPDFVALDAPHPLNSLSLVAEAISEVSAVPGARILWVQGGLSRYSPKRGNRARPYATVQAAHDAAFAGDLICVEPGGDGTDAFGRAYYTDSFLWEKDVRIVMLPGVVYGGLFQCSRFLGQSGFKARTLIGGEFLGRVLLWRQSTTECSLRLFGVRFSGLGFFEVAGGGSYGDSYVTRAILRNCEFDSSIGAGNFGPVVVSGRDDMGPVALELDNTLVFAPNTECITFVANAASRVTLRGGSELRGPVKSRTLNTIPSGFAMQESDWLVDARPAGNSSAAPAYTAGAGINITNNVISSTGGGASSYDVSGAKRQAVAYENKASLLENDEQFANKQFYDEVTLPGALYWFRCAIFSMPNGDTQLRWVRTQIIS